MSNKVTHGSIEELRYFEAREKRHTIGPASETGPTHQQNVLSSWVSPRIRQIDPDGKRALALTEKYRNKKNK